MEPTSDRPRSRIKRFGAWLSHELGLRTLLDSPRDIHILILSRFLRMLAYGASALILALYFAALGHSDSRIGLFMTLTLLGDVVVSLLLTLIADSLGRRRTLILGAVMMAIAGTVFATTGNYWALLAAAVIGVISPSGNEIGPFRAVEESTLAQLVEKPEQRPDVFAWYVVLAQVGTSVGLIGCGFVIERLESKGGWSEIDAYRVAFWSYAGIGVTKCLLAFGLSSKCEIARELPPVVVEEQDPSPSAIETEPLLPRQSSPAASIGATTKRTRKSPLAQISRQTVPILLKLCAFFALDSLASGMAPFSLINYYLDRKFSLPKSELGVLMSASWFCGALFNLFAASLAKRIGLIKTMVFTHLPSSVFLGLLPFPQSLALTMLLLVARACLNSMDQAPRSAFLSAVVKPNERTAVMGIVNVVKTLSQSGGPVITGVLAQGGRFWIAFVAAGALKVLYDVGLLAMFVNVKLHEHEGKHGEQTVRTSEGDLDDDIEEDGRQGGTRARNENNR